MAQGRREVLSLAALSSVTSAAVVAVSIALSNQRGARPTVVASSAVPKAELSRPLGRT